MKKAVNRKVAAFYFVRKIKNGYFCAAHRIKVMKIQYASEDRFFSSQQKSLSLQWNVTICENNKS